MSDNNNNNTYNEETPSDDDNYVDSDVSSVSSDEDSIDTEDSDILSTIASVGSEQTDATTTTTTNEVFAVTTSLKTVVPVRKMPEKKLSNISKCHVEEKVADPVIPSAPTLTPVKTPSYVNVPKINFGQKKHVTPRHHIEEKVSDSVKSVKVSGDVTTVDLDKELTTESITKAEPVLATVNVPTPTPTTVGVSVQKSKPGLKESEHVNAIKELNNVKDNLKEGEVLNPFYLNKSINQVNPYDYEVFKSFTQARILCLKDDVKIDVATFTEIGNIYDQVINKNTLKKVCGYFDMFTTGTRLVYVKKHQESTIRVKGEDIQEYFPNEKFDINEMIILMLERSRRNAVIYTSFYQKDVHFNDLRTALSLVKFYNKDKDGLVKEKVISMICGIDHSFWADKRNCNINMTNEFNERIYVKCDKVEDDTGYGHTKNVKKNPRIFTVLQTLQNQKKERTYYAQSFTEKNGFTKKSVFDLYKLLTEDYERYYYLTTLMTSKSYCHLVFCNADLLKVATPFIEKHRLGFKYAMSYGWLYMYIDEGIFHTRTTKNSRYVMDINTACLLPKFYTLSQDLHQNPYTTYMLDEKVADPMRNYQSLWGMSDLKYYGTCTLPVFQKRFNLFMTGREDSDIFKGLNWKKFGVSGSVIPACLQKWSPLIENVSTKDLSEADRFLMFIRNYYSGSDVDLMCKCNNLYEFMDLSVHVIDTIKNNITDYKDDDIHIDYVKNSMVHVTDDFIAEYLDDIKDHLFESGNDEFDTKKIKSLVNSLDTEMVEYIYEKYLGAKKKINSNISKYYSENVKQKKNHEMTKKLLKLFVKKTPRDKIRVKMQPEFLKGKDILGDNNNGYSGEMKFYVNDFKSEKDHVSPENNKLLFVVLETIRFQFTSPKIMRCIELFSTKWPDFFALVGKFHYPCVRAYYQGDNVWIEPSCLTAMMTGNNMDYKYFSSTKDPTKIGNKYRTRGFGSMYNEEELKHCLEYNATSNDDGGLYKIDPKDEEAVKKYLSPQEISSDIFKKLLKTDPNVKEESYLNPKLPYIKTFEQFAQLYKDEYKNVDMEDPLLNMFHAKNVTKGGYVEPYKHWVTVGYWDKYGKNLK